MRTLMLALSFLMQEEQVEKARKTLDEVLAKMKNSSAISYEVSGEQEYIVRGSELATDRYSGRVLLKRPNLWRVELRADDPMGYDDLVLYDGSTVWTYSQKFKEYRRSSGPESPPVFQGPVLWPIRGFYFDAGYTSLTKAVDPLAWVQVEKEGDEEWNVLFWGRQTQEDTLTNFLHVDKQGRIRRHWTSDYKWSPPLYHGVLFKNWNFEPKVSDADFSFCPPEGAKELK